MRQFETGATRDGDDGKLDYEGFLSPQVLARFAQYMHQHRIQANGEVRDSDNWQKGIPPEAYMKSMWRHFMEVWTIYRRGEDISHEEEIALQEALCAMMFNVMGYLHEELSLVGMHLPGHGDFTEPGYDDFTEGDLERVTLAPPAEDGQGLDPFEAEEQTAPCHRDDREWNEGGNYFFESCTPSRVPDGAPTNTGKGCGA